MCMRERERERERERKKEKERERERDSDRERDREREGESGVRKRRLPGMRRCPDPRHNPFPWLGNLLPITNV